MNKRKTMQFRRYVVTVMDNWTPLRLFWTLKGALRWLPQTTGYLYWWDGKSWRHLTVEEPGELYGKPLMRD